MTGLCVCLVNINANNTINDTYLLDVSKGENRPKEEWFKAGGIIKGSHLPAKTWTVTIPILPQNVRNVLFQVNYTGSTADSMKGKTRYTDNSHLQLIHQKYKTKEKLIGLLSTTYNHTNVNFSQITELFFSINKLDLSRLFVLTQ